MSWVREDQLPEGLDVLMPAMAALGEAHRRIEPVRQGGVVRLVSFYDPEEVERFAAASVVCLLRTR